MKRLLTSVLILTTLFGTALVATRTVFAAPQKGSSTLAGIVLGPNDKPVARAAITYQSSAGNAPHVVRTDASPYPNSSRTTTTSALPPTASSRSGKKT